METLINLIKDFMLSTVEWFRRTSGITKVVICLFILQTVVNVGAIIYSEQKVNEVNTSINQQIEGNKKIVTKSISSYDENGIMDMFNDYFDSIGKLFKYVSFIIITMFISYIVYFICKFFDIFRDLMKIFAELDNDWWALKFIFIYDVSGILWDLYTLYGIFNY